MEIGQFYKEFVERTHLELISYNGPHEFTTLLNATFGLLIVPYESQKEESTLAKVWDKPPEEAFTGPPPYDLHLFEPIRGRDKETGQLTPYEKTFGNLLRKIRNGLAHSHIEPVGDGHKWVSIVVWNCFPVRKSDPEAKSMRICTSADSELSVKDLEIEFSWEQLQKFATFVADEHLKYYAAQYP